MADPQIGPGENFFHQQWTKQQGLPDNQVNAVFQSREGYLWLATRGGLARFDGVRFSLFNRTTAPVLSDDNCTALAEDATGRLWVGTPQGFWSPHGLPLTQFEPVPFSHSNSVGVLHADRQGTMWVGTGDGLVRWDGRSSKRFLSESPSTKIGTGGIMETTDGTVWAGTLAGLYRLALGTTDFVRSGPPDQNDGVNAFAVCSDSQQRVWVLFGPVNDGRARLSYFEQGQWRTIQAPEIHNGGRRKFLFADHAGNLWMPGEVGTLYRLCGGQFEQIQLPGDASRDYALCMTEDSEGGLWIGTESQGVLRLKPKTVWTATSEDGLPHNKVWSIGEGQDGLIWLGTENGLARLSGGRMTSHSSQEGMTKNAVRVVARDKAGRIWFGTKNTLACVEGGQVRQFRFPGEWFNTKVNALWAGSGDVLWVGTVKGLYRVDASALPVQSSAEPGFYTLPMPLISRFLRQDFTPTCGRWLRMVMAPSGVPFHEWAWLASAKG